MTSQRLIRRQKGMRVLSWLHFILAAFLFFMVLITIIVGPDEFGASIHKGNAPALSSLNQYSDKVTGISMTILLIFYFFMEIYLALSCRRKANHPKKLLFTLVFSGIRVVMALFTFARAGLANIAWYDTGYTLALNLATFLLALQMKRGMTKTEPENRETGEESV